ncbi:hypothetical protein Taro_036347 [Colocasia esculenta]|uniref:Uncharacterized protein n=1 Tax=Colocasia esculenta TaxID=4460 RepID=A0A843W1C3_COLES|nr:hypothetical protein [Colocasia esculenta]
MIRKGPKSTRRYTLDTVPFGHVDWTPYAGEDDTVQPWVEQGRIYFDRDIWLHAFNTVVPLHLRLVAQTLGLHQRSWERPGSSFRGIQQVTDWTVRVREQLEDWEQRGRVVTSEATSDEDYFRAYAQRYGAQVYKGTRRLLDPEGRITSLEGVLHSTIQQRDDLQQTVTQLLTDFYFSFATRRAGAGAADGGRCLHLMRRARPLRAGGPASSGGEMGGGCRGRAAGAGGRSEGLSSADSCAREGDGRDAPTPPDRRGDRTALGGGRAPFVARERAASLRAAEVRDEGAREGLGIGWAQPFLGQQERHPERVCRTLSDRFLRTTEERGGGTTARGSSRGEHDGTERDGPSTFPPP